jgi:hypothetical protein
MAQIIKLIYLLEEKRDSKVYKVFKDLKVILVNVDHKVSKVFKENKVPEVRLDHKARLDRKVKRGPHLLMMILHLNNLSY